MPPPRPPLPLPARNEPFLQTHTINSSKIFIFNTLYMNKDLPKKKKRKKEKGFYWERDFSALERKILLGEGQWC